MSALAENIRKNEFKLGTGENSHMSYDKKCFTPLLSSSGTMQCTSQRKKFEIKGDGSIIGKYSNGMEVILNNVLYNPDLNGLLISDRKIDNEKYTIIFKNKKIVY